MKLFMIVLINIFSMVASLPLVFIGEQVSALALLFLSLAWWTHYEITN